MYSSYIDPHIGNVPFKEQVGEILKKIKKRECALKEKELHLKDPYKFSSKIAQYKFELGFGNGNKGIHRYLTNSYLEHFEELKIIYKQCISFEESVKVISKKIHDAKKTNKKATVKRLQNEISDIRRSLKNLVPEMRKWIIQQEMDVLLSAKIKRNKDNESSWFFYPDFKKIFNKELQLENIFKKEWDKDINQIVTQARKYGTLYGPEFINEFIENIKYEIKKIEKTEKNGYLKEIYLLVIAFMEFEESVSFDRTYYSLCDAMLRLCLVFEGINPYTEFTKDALYALAKRDIDILVDYYNESFMHTNQLFIFNYAYIGLQAQFHNDENVYEAMKEVTSKADEGDIAESYLEAVNLKENIKQVVNGDKLAAIIHPKLVIGSLCAVNHFKNIRKYLDLVEKFNLFELEESEVLSIKDIPKKDAAFLMRKRTKDKATISTLEDYLRENKLPKYQNNNKYKELNKLIKSGEIMVSKDRGTRFIDKKSFIKWLKKRKDYRKLHTIKKPKLKSVVTVEKIASLLAQ